MKHKAIFIFLITLILSHPQTGSGQAITGSDLLDICGNDKNKMKIDETYCLGYVSGILEYSLEIGKEPFLRKMKKEKTMEQAQKEVIAYLENHPNLLDQPAATLVMKALKEKFPVSKTEKK